MDNDISPQGYQSPLSTFLPQTPTQQRKDAEKEREETLMQLPLLRTVLKRLEKRLAETDSNKVTRLVAQKYDLDGDTAMALQDRVHDILEAEKRYIEGRISRIKQ